MIALTSLSVPLTIEDSGPKQWKRYRHRSGKWYWRNYRREVKGGVSLVERFAIAQDEAHARMVEYLNQPLWVNERGERVNA